MDAKSWLELATSDEREGLTKTHEGTAADGMRMHIVNSTTPCTCGNEKVHKGFDGIISKVKDTPFAFAINRQYLLDALQGFSGNNMVLFFMERGGKTPIVIQDLLASQTAIIMPMQSEGTTKPQDLPTVTPVKVETPNRFQIAFDEEYENE